MAASTQRKIFMGCDGFGEDLKNGLKSHLEGRHCSRCDNHNADVQIHDFGTDTYFDIAGKVATAVLQASAVDKNEQIADASSTSSSSSLQPPRPAPLGVLICGTGMGVGMVANKFPGIRAATVENIVATRYARAVNNANVLCLGQLITPLELAKDMLDAFLQQEFCTTPTLEDGVTPAPWWNDQVETFLGTSLKGMARVEQQAKRIPSPET